MKINAIKPVTNKDIVTNFVGNLLTRAGGDIAATVVLILTKDDLYLEYKGHTAIGYAEETRDIKKIALGKIMHFTVLQDQDEEQIKIQTEKNEYLFLRDNTQEDNLGLALSNLINEYGIS